MSERKTKAVGHRDVIVAVALSGMMFASGCATSSGTKSARISSDRTATARKDPMEIKLAQQKQALNGSRWVIGLVADGRPDEKSQDVLIFENQRFQSQEMEREGFGSTNFSVSMLEGDVVAFETMQSHETLGKVFWRGEIQAGGQLVRGVKSRVLPGEPSADYYFDGTKETISSEAAQSL